MNRIWVHLGAALACGVGAWLMAASLFGYGWWGGEQGGLEIRGSVINVLLCSKADDPDPLPMGVGDHDGCMSQSYHRGEARASRWFVGPMHMTLMGGAAAAALFFLFAGALALALEFAVVPRSQQLGFAFFDVDNGVVEVHQHPGRQACYLSVLALVALAIAAAAAPENLSAGPDLLQFVAGTLLALGAGAIADPRVLARERVATRPSIGSESDAKPDSVVEDARGATDALPEAEVETNDTPACLRCGKQTAWLEKVARHRCLACGLYQPLHAPGSQVDSP